MKMRTRTLDVDCPHCGTSLQGVEQANEVAEESAPIGWMLIRRYCPKGRRLSVKDFPDE